MTYPLALDTSVAVPLLARRHAAHDVVVRWRAGRSLVLSGHSQAETYSVLTRLPGILRLAPADAARLLRERFGPPLSPHYELADLPTLLATAGVYGGQVYDAMVALAARAHDAELATRDARAAATYEAVGVRVIRVL